MESKEEPADPLVDYANESALPMREVFEYPALLVGRVKFQQVKKIKRL